MNRLIVLAFSIFAVTIAAWSQGPDAKYRLTLQDGRVILATSVRPSGVEDLDITTTNGNSMVVRRADLVRLEVRMMREPGRGKILRSTGYFIEPRGGYLMPQEDIDDFEAGLSFGGAIGYSTGVHTVEASFDYFFSAGLKNGGSGDTVRLNIAAVSYVLSLRIAGQFRLNVGVGPSMVFLSRRGNTVGFGQGSQFTALFSGGFSLGPFYTYGKYLFPFEHDEITQKPKQKIKYGGINVGAGLRL